ncbi:MAG: hypothetical protein ACRD36_00765, partial [Candidatus Acidiferrum sp.]
LLNRDNRRLDITGNGFQNSAAQFVQLTKTAKGKQYPAYFSTVTSFLKATSAYAPRQVQVAVKLRF